MIIKYRFLLRRFREMCIEHTILCNCGVKKASFHFRDDVMTSEVVDRLYCPECSGGIVLDQESMLHDNGRVISYDMDLARFLASQLQSREITPGFIFDEGYCTWAGVYPTDHADSARERRELLPIAKIDKRRYFEEFRRWSLERTGRLYRAGWRKAADGHKVTVQTT
jgi:hypothetical protein